MSPGRQPLRGLVIAILLAMCVAGCRSRGWMTRQDLENGVVDPRETEAGKTLLGQKDADESAEELPVVPPPEHRNGAKTTTALDESQDLSPETIATIVDVAEIAQTVNTLANGEGFNLGAQLGQQGSQTQAALAGMKGYVSYKQGEFGAAIDRFTDAINKDPDNPRLWSARAEAFFAMGQYEYALGDVRQALGKESHNPDAWFLQGQIFELAGEYEPALRSYQAAARLRKDHADSWIKQSGVLSQLQRHDDAIAAARQAVALKPADPATHTALGFTYAESGRIEPALAAFRDALERNPDHARAYFGRGSLALMAGQTSIAEADLNRAVELAPEFGNARHRRGMLRFQQQRFDEALDDVRTALEDPHVEPHAYNTLGTVYLAINLPEQAVGAYDEMLRRVSDDVTALSNRSHALTRLKRYDEAIVDAKHAIAIKVDFADAHNHLGNALLMSGEAKAALEAYDTALRLSPSHPQYRANRASALLAGGQTDAAVAEFNALLESRPPDSVAAMALWRRAEAWDAAGAADRARTDRLTAAALDPAVKTLPPLRTATKR
ncbi:MAG: tetratricopeptide repeat protein [Planctomycetaceae bacterium]|nr:tetratricopeptide repeat protein [Planctomycetaceae bacterium]